MHDQISGKLVGAGTEFDTGTISGNSYHGTWENTGNIGSEELTLSNDGLSFSGTYYGPDGSFVCKVYGVKSAN